MGAFCRAGECLADLVEVLDARAGCAGSRRSFAGQAVSEVGPPCPGQGVPLALDVLCSALHELDLLAVVEQGCPDRPEDVVGGRPSTSALNRYLKSLSRADVVVLQERDERGRVTVDRVHRDRLRETAEGARRGCPGTRRTTRVEHREAGVAAGRGWRGSSPSRVYHQAGSGTGRCRLRPCPPTVALTCPPRRRRGRLGGLPGIDILEQVPRSTCLTASICNASTPMSRQRLIAAIRWSLTSRARSPDRCSRPRCACAAADMRFPSRRLR